MGPYAEAALIVQEVMTQGLNLRELGGEGFVIGSFVMCLLFAS
jgi:hypothetical protein